MSLSNKIRVFKEGEELWTDGTQSIVLTREVREAVKELKKRTKERLYDVMLPPRPIEPIISLIDEIFGSELTKQDGAGE